MITIHKILEIYDINPSDVLLVRHGNKHIAIRETFSNDIPRLEAYQSFQQPRKFKKAKSIAVFAPYYKTTALFLGLWDILGCTDNAQFTNEILLELRKHNLPESWFNDSCRYDLRRNNILDDLSERLVIEWGRQTVKWWDEKDKEVIELRGKQSIGEFQSFSQIEMDFRELKMLTQSPATNMTWVKALSSVNGVYLIKDKSSGKLYVGSAYGARGIYGRWSAYASDGHGGNLELRNLDPRNFQFSILEIVPATTTVDDVIACENRWKEKLGTRQFGLNH
jgi:hypothetical protein